MRVLLINLLSSYISNIDYALTNNQISNKFQQQYQQGRKDAYKEILELIK